MGKVSVVTVVRARLRSAIRQGKECPQIDEKVDLLARSCINNAKKMLQLFEGLTRTKNLTRFSFTDFQGCSIATIILLVAGIIDEEGDCKKRATFGLQCLRRMSGGNPTAIMGIHFVEAVESISTEAATQMETVRAREGTAVPRTEAPTMSDYIQWTQWLTTAVAREPADMSHSDHLSTAYDGLTMGTLPSNVQNTAMTNPLVSDLVRVTSEWEQAAAVQLQQMPTSSFVFPEVRRETLDNGAPQESITMGTDYHTTIYGDDHFYLMGLTGLDMLDFSDSPDQVIHLP
jgi:hypothetical protein